jgi:prepilin peptidase CpaA
VTQHALATILALGLAGLVAGWLDWRHRRLPNWLCMMLAILGLAAAFRYGGLELLGASLIHGAMALCIGIILFSSNVIGGGDGKYYAAAASWFPVAYGFVLLLCVSIAGIFVYAGWWGSRRLRGIEIDSSPEAPVSAKLPYGLAIAAGSTMAALLQLR